MSASAAEAALRKFGTTVREALLVAATACSPPVEARVTQACGGAEARSLY